ncbi:MAG: class I SAM-dependent methyltransferase [Thermoleophilaceae bacterium]|nr:class I SAM-dependent methyltransferase [Thermoleophilaceae bacterium]
MIYQHPLAYLIGLQGIALLRAFSGVYDRDFTLARFRDIQTLLDSAEALGEGVEARPITSREGYDRWAPFYDEPGNQLLDIEQPIMREILDSLPVGVALDAACGTGRHTEYLASLGHKVIGVDTSPEMLALACAKVPGGAFYEADLHDVPLGDGSVDLVVCAVALSHVPDLGQALAEFVRVLRPNGHLVISDSRGLIGDIGLPMVRVGPGGEIGYMPIWSRLASDYLAAALPLGLQVRRCEEPRRPSPVLGDDGRTLYVGERLPDHVPGDPPNIWSLHTRAIAATNAAWHDKPAAIIWHLQLSAADVSTEFAAPDRARVSRGHS